MKSALFTLALAALLTRTVPCVAGIADSPLPVLTVGVDTLHLYSVPGVIGGAGGLSTFFSCTSTDTAPREGVAPRRDAATLADLPPLSISHNSDTASG